MVRNEQIGVVARVSFNLGIALFLGLVSLVAFVLYFLVPAIRSELTFATSVIGGAAAIYAAYYAGAGLKLNAQRESEKISLHFMDHLNDIDVSRLQSRIKSHQFRELGPKEAFLFIESNSELQSDVRLLLGLFEDLSIAVHSRIADEAFLYRSLSFLVPLTYRSLQGYIEEYRKQESDVRIYQYTQFLAEAWSAGKSVQTGQSYPHSW